MRFEGKTDGEAGNAGGDKALAHEALCGHHAKRHDESRRIAEVEKRAVLATQNATSVHASSGAFSADDAMRNATSTKEAAMSMHQRPCAQRERQQGKGNRESERGREVDVAGDDLAVLV